MQSSASVAGDASQDFLRGASIIREIKASGIEFVVSVPDITTSEGLLRPLSQMQRLRGSSASARRTKASASAPGSPTAASARCC